MLVFKARPRRDPAQREDITESQKRIMRLMVKAMKEVRDQIEDNEGLLMDALQHSSADKVVALVTVEPWLEMQEALQDELQAELVAAGDRVKLPRIEKALATFRFNAPNKDASNFAVQQGAGLVAEVISDQRKTIKSLVSDAQMGRGLAPKAMARQLKNVVGLTTQQAGWVRNFEDRAISQAMAGGKTFDQALEVSAKSTQRYHDKIHRYRTETISRTETLKASNAGRNEAWKQGVDGGFISPTAVREWQAESSACDLCMPLNGVQVPLSESFPQGDPPRHPNCRCNVKLVDEIPEDILSMTDSELDVEISGLLGGVNSTNYGGFDLRNPVNGLGDRAEYGDEAVAVARRLREEMVVVEPEITRDIIDLAGKYGANPEGLAFRVKSEDSLSRKIFGEIQQGIRKGKPITYEEAVGEMRDTVRYTYTMDESSYASTTVKILEDLKGKGYTADVKNYWKKDNTYKGVNVALKNSDGVPVELQFHTPESLRIKEGILHEIYERQRVLTDEVAVKALDDEMRVAAAQIPVPTGDLGFGRVLTKTLLIASRGRDDIVRFVKRSKKGE
jgi:hypothetical protein